MEACLDGQLGDSRRRSLKDHLALCRSCRERVDSLRQFEAELQRRLRSMRHEVSLWQPLGLETTPGAAPGTGPGPVQGLVGPLRRVPRVAPVILPPLATVETAGGGLVARRGHRLRGTPARDATPVLAGGFGSAFGAGLRGRLQGLAGMALIVAAVGAVADLALSGLGWLSADRRAAVYRAYVDGEVDLDLRTAEPARLSLWLGEQLGRPVSLPAAPGGFALIGGTAVDEQAADSGAMAVYATVDGPALLMIESLEATAAVAGDGSPLGLVAAAKVVVEDGLSRLDWQDGRLAYSLIGALPPDKLALFAD